ncbi:MAG: bile acid:sodium symporter family protein [Opitutales bacterium]
MGLKLLNSFSTLFPVWVLAACSWAILQPEAFTWFSGPWIVWGLGIIMFGMGITLRVEDFAGALKTPQAVVVGVVGQFMLMPAIAWGIARLFALPPAFAAGLILVACCPGGTASNVVAYLARANVALSVLMTFVSTTVAVGLTPVLTQWVAGAYVPVDAWALFGSMVRIVLLPVALGIGIHHLAPKLTDRIAPVGPAIAVIVIALICASIVGSNRAAVLEYGLLLIGAVASLHAVAFAAGYGFARLCRTGERAARTISIEVGMQNSGLATVLARAHFADPLVAIPGSLSAFTHSVIGSLLAAIWRLRQADDGKPPPDCAA